MKPAHAALEDREQAEMSDTRMKRGTPLRVFQPAANQRLSCRKITCKAFPFVVEEQRVTSYFLLVKKRRGEKSSVPSETLWICPLNFSLYLWLDVEICLVFLEDFSLLFAGVTWWKRLAEITEERGSPLEQESKSVGCLLRWL